MKEIGLSFEITVLARIVNIATSINFHFLPFLGAGGGGSSTTGGSSSAGSGGGGANGSTITGCVITISFRGLFFRKKAANHSAGSLGLEQISLIAHGF